jgi:CrcB protein
VTSEILWLSVALGTVGAVLRWLLLQGLPGKAWVATLIVNIAGSALAGGIIAFPAVASSAPLVAGLCGGLTTFSTLALQLLPGTTFSSPSRLVGLALAHGVGGVGACLGMFFLVSTALS